MSRIGNNPISIPGGVEIKFDNGVVSVKGPKGELSQNIDSSIGVDIDGDTLTVTRSTEEKQHKAILISDHMYRYIIDLSDSIYLLKNGCFKKIEDIKELEDYKYLSEGSLI